MDSDSQRLANEVIEIARHEGIPVLGMGPCAGMADEPPGYRPEDLLAGASGMICFGIPVPRGVLNESRYTTEQIWRTQNLYYRRLDGISLRLAQLIEEHGARAVPVFGCAPLDVNSRGDVVGELNQIRMAVLTGIGFKGRNGLLLHPRHGSRLMLGGLVTTAALPTLRLSEQVDGGCPEGCRICIDACPVRAISSVSGRVRIMRCLGHAALTPLMPRLRFGILAKTNPAAAARLMNERAFDEHTMHTCSKCVAMCPYGEDS